MILIHVRLSTGSYIDLLCRAVMDGFVLGEYWYSETDTTGCYFYSTLMYFLIAYTLLLVRRCKGN